jgi:Predicted hydrolases or acyltransferases (alpha/beta hydrolase superfamily)
MQIRRRLTAIVVTLGLAGPCLAGGTIGLIDKPPGQLVDIGGYQLHIFCQGTGAPTVIFDSGLGGFSLEWFPVQRLLAGKVMVCAYDRAGYAWSDPGPVPRTTDHMVQELHTLLHHVPLVPPYILVGHSFGGYNALYFAKHYPEETAGIVLVDSSHPQQTERLPDIPARRDKSVSSETITMFRDPSVLSFYPEDIRPELMHILSTANLYKTYRRESLGFAASGGQVEQAGLVPEVPLVVITRGKRVWPDDPYGDALEREWQRMQKELVGMTASGRQVIAERSGHMVHLEQPELVADSILSVLGEARESAECLSSRTSKTSKEDLDC